MGSSRTPRQIDASKRREPPMDRLGQIERVSWFCGNCGFENLSRFFFHRPPIVGGPGLQTGLRPFIDLAD
jgi:hypothetical protein